MGACAVQYHYYHTSGKGFKKDVGMFTVSITCMGGKTIEFGVNPEAVGNAGLENNLFSRKPKNGVGRVDSRIISVDEDTADKIIDFLYELSKGFSGGLYPDGKESSMAYWQKFSARLMDAVHGMIFKDPTRHFFETFSEEAMNGLPLSPAMIVARLAMSHINYYAENPYALREYFQPGNDDKDVKLYFNREEGVLKGVVSGGLLSFAIPATSGKGDCINNPKCEDMPFKGPIPAGNYKIFTGAIDDPDFIHDINLNRKGDWGDWNVPLQPESDNGAGRSHFYIHGGTLPGSAGCIDIGGGILGNNISDFLKDILKTDSDGVIDVTVS